MHNMGTHGVQFFQFKSPFISIFVIHTYSIENFNMQSILEFYENTF